MWLGRKTRGFFGEDEMEVLMIFIWKVCKFGRIGFQTVCVLKFIPFMY